jgi:biotin carboxylase
MNYICFSPYFPPNYFRFSISLKKYGVNVLGIGDAPYDHLHPELKAALTEYYRVDDLHNYNQLLSAMGYFINKFGKIDGIDSHNEYWLETEARLRKDFNIEGLKPEEMSRIRKKSEMKKVFQKAGLNIARGIPLGTFERALYFAKKIGYPLIAKPDSGVGAANTYKIEDDNGLKDFFLTKPAVDYLIEEFIRGDIFSFDGLADKSGKLVFYTALKNEKGVMEVVHEDSHVYYYSLRDIPADLEEAGKKILTTFGVRGRFFHFEFFLEHKTGRLVALEVNIRPPGGFTTDMFNFASDINVYDVWAAMITNHRLTADFTRKYHVCFVSRKWKYEYQYSHEELFEKYHDIIVFHDRLDDILSRAMGNYCYLLRSPDLNTIFEVQQAIHRMKCA